MPCPQPLRRFAQSLSTLARASSLLGALALALPLAAAVPCGAAPSQDSALPPKLPAPPAEARRRARNELRERLLARFESAPAERVKFVEFLLAEAPDPNRSPANCYACLAEARDLASDLGDVGLALASIERLDGIFVIEARVMRSDVAIRMLEAANPLAPLPAGLLELALGQIDASFRSEDYATMAKLDELVRPVAGHAEAARERLQTSARRLAAYNEVAPALRRLAEQPADPEANLAAARFDLFVRADFARGFARLAAVADAALAELARRELASPAKALERNALAQGWRDLGGTAKGDWRDFAREREVHWLQAALAVDVDPALDPIERRAAEDRLAVLRPGSAPTASGDAQRAAQDPAAPRTPVPNGADVAAERDRLQERLAADFSNLNVTRRRALVDKLLSLVDGAAGATRFAILSECLEQAILGADVGRTESVLERLVRDYELDELEFRSEAVARLGARIQNSSAEAYGDLLLPLLARCLDEGRLAAAELLVAEDVQKNFQQRSNDPDHKAEYRALRAEVEAQRALVELEARFRADPKDYTARLWLGRHATFVLLDFERGFELLSEGSNDTLRQIARDERAERTAPKDAEQCLALAESWTKWATAELDQRAARVGLERARHWAQRALELGFDDVLAELQAKGLLQSQIEPALAALPAKEAPRERRERATFGVRRSGAAKALQRTVAGAVDWLLANQSADGRWDGAEHGGEDLHDIGVTGLAVLALMSSGDPRALKAIEMASDWLMTEQDLESGRIGEDVGFAFLYSHAIATQALCRALRHAPRPELTAACQGAVKYIEGARNPYGAWRYDAPPNGDNDTSVTAWMVAALKAVDRAGLTFDAEAFVGARSWLDEVTDPATGRCGYDAVGTMSSRVEGRNEEYLPEKGEAMTAAALYSRFLMGEEPGRSPVMRAHADLLLKCLPKWEPGMKGNDMYYWHYGSLALFRMGGKYWETWRPALEGALLLSQRTDGEEAGSWDPIGPWGWSGGRVYSTSVALLALTAAWQPK